MDDSGCEWFQPKWLCMNLVVNDPNLSGYVWTQHENMEAILSVICRWGGWGWRKKFFFCLPKSATLLLFISEQERSQTVTPCILSKLSALWHVQLTVLTKSSVLTQATQVSSHAALQPFELWFDNIKWTGDNILYTFVNVFYWGINNVAGPKFMCLSLIIFITCFPSGGEVRGQMCRLLGPTVAGGWLLFPPDPHPHQT